MEKSFDRNPVLKSNLVSRLFNDRDDHDKRYSVFENRLSALEAELGSVNRKADNFEAKLKTLVEQLRRILLPLSKTASTDNVEKIVQLVMSRIASERPWVDSLYLPPPGLATQAAGAYMASSTCSADDIVSEAFASFCTGIGRRLSYHRKIWEWAFIAHHLGRLGMLDASRRGLGFGVGTEPLPSLFAAAGAAIVATDAPHDQAVEAGWTLNSEHALKLEDIRIPEIIDAARFAERVSYETCDMNNISPTLSGFDFCWSSCCFEHLGSLDAGMDFVVNSVEKTLKIGGVACHTTEFNLSSDSETVADGPTVIYRKQDMLRLIERLRDRGHQVDDLIISSGHHPLDFYVDLPPYWRGPHLRLQLMGFTVTSVGLVIRRGR